MMKQSDGIEGSGLTRGAVDNPLQSKRRGKTLGWQVAVLHNVMQ